MDENRHGGNIYYAEMITGIPASGIIDFSVNLNPLGTPAELKNIIRDSLDEIMYYPDPAYTASRSAIAAYHRVPIEYITTGNGATEIISLVCRVLKPAKALLLRHHIRNMAVLLKIQMQRSVTSGSEMKTGIRPILPL